jgi:nitrogenase molybdenum-iron protein NifN
VAFWEEFAMTAIRPSTKACTINPLKMSPALGGSLAFLGIDSCLPLLHGSQGCTAFALVLAVRHFREAIPLQTTAMSEISTILGGADNVEQAIDNIRGRANPKVIGLCSTALTETRDEDMAGDLKLMKVRRTEWNDLSIAFARTPDYAGSLETGWARAVESLIETMVPSSPLPAVRSQINILAGQHLSAADIDELRDLAEAFGLRALVLPDLSRSLDGHVPDDFVGTTLGGTTVDEIHAMGRSACTIVCGEHLRTAGELLENRAGIPFVVFDRLTGLEPVDGLVKLLADLSGRAPSPRIERERSRLIDAMLDGHFYFPDRSLVVAGEADSIYALSSLVTDMGGRVKSAVAAASSSVLERITADDVIIGDFDDVEQRLSGGRPCDLMIANAHAAPIAERTGVALIRYGFPVFDRLGAAQRLSVGYRGTRGLIVEIANALIDASDHTHETLATAGAQEMRHDGFDGAQVAFG